MSHTWPSFADEVPRMGYSRASEPFFSCSVGSFLGSKSEKAKEKSAEEIRCVFDEI